jgi:hypothetical protein
MKDKKIEKLIDAIGEFIDVRTAKDWMNSPHVPEEEKHGMREFVRGRLREALIRVLEDGDIRR